MPLTAGDKLGPYEIISLIGKGGMGEVYRAHDPRTGRDVAIKVSAERFSERFDREVRAVASLNHPNICTLFDVGPNYLVMEFIEGEAPKGPLALEEALKIARQIAAALEEAHEKNTTHRDLKPGNVMVKPDGSVKVLDFGLAKVGPRTASGGEQDAEHSPTISMAATQAGVILGTAAYMSPEQARGKTVDKRADIWAFGVVLYEMVTGKRLFQGEDLTETLASVVKERPDLSDAPPQVRRLIQRCLEKDPRKRLRDIGDVWELLDEHAPAAQSALPPQSRFGSLPWIAAGVMTAVAAVALWAPWRSTQPADRPLVRLDVDLGADVSLYTGTVSTAGSSVAISPDGTRLAYVSGTPPKLFTRRLDQSKATELPGSVGNAPFFSLDGQWIGFLTPGGLNKISVEGGAVVALSSVRGVGPSWSEDGNVYVGGQNGVVRIRDSGGAPEIVAAPANGEFVLGFPQLLPGGKAVLFAAYTAPNPDASSIEVMTLADRHRKTVSRGGTSPHYLATSNGAGYLIYNNKATLFAIPFDLDKLETRGAALPMVDDVAFNGPFGTAQLSFSRNGTLVYRRSGEETRLLTVAWLDGAGKSLPLLSKPGVYGRPSVSPDGQRVALDVSDGSGTDIWAYDWQRDTMTRLTFTGRAENAVWTPDGRYIVFRAVGEGMSATRSDGAGKAQALTQSKDVQDPWSFTPDGKRLAFMDNDPKTQFDMWTVPLESESGELRAGKPEVYLQTAANERSPSLSPDGRWLAYFSDESGVFQVYVRAFPDRGGKWQISNSGGTYPMWSGSGHELLFETPDRKIMAAAYTAKGDSFVADKPRLWSDRQPGGPDLNRNVDISPDGKRIAALMPAVESKGAQEAQNHVVFLENFFDELRRKVPTGK